MTPLAAQVWAEILAIHKTIRINSREISARIGVGRDRVRRAINELIAEGRLTLSKYKIAGRWNSAYEVQALCPIDSPSSVSSTAIRGHKDIDLLTEIYSPYHASHENAPECIEKHEMHRKDPKYMGWDEIGFDAKESHGETQNPFKSSAAPAKAKARRDSMRQKQTRHRSEKPLEQWTVKDVAQEFHAEMNKHLPMMSWNMYQSRFIMALADFRAANDSDARLELQIMRMFWANPYHWETCDGPEQIWKRFIKLAPGVIPWANRIVNKVPVSVQNEILDKQWEEFYAEYGNIFEETHETT